MPIERAVPNTILVAASMSVAFMSSIFCSATFFACSRVILATLSRFGTAEPFSMKVPFSTIVEQAAFS